MTSSPEDTYSFDDYDDFWTSIDKVIIKDSRCNKLNYQIEEAPCRLVHPTNEEMELNEDAHKANIAKELAGIYLDAMDIRDKSIDKKHHQIIGEASQVCENVFKAIDFVDEHFPSDKSSLRQQFNAQLLQLEEERHITLQMLKEIESSHDKCFPATDHKDLTEVAPDLHLEHAQTLANLYIKAKTLYPDEKHAIRDMIIAEVNRAAEALGDNNGKIFTKLFKTKVDTLNQGKGGSVLRGSSGPKIDKALKVTQGKDFMDCQAKVRGLIPSGEFLGHNPQSLKSNNSPQQVQTK